MQFHQLSFHFQYSLILITLFPSLRSLFIFEIVIFSGKFYAKVRYVYSIAELGQLIPIEYLYIPEEVLVYVLICLLPLILLKSLFLLHEFRMSFPIVYPIATISIHCPNYIERKTTIAPEIIYETS